MYLAPATLLSTEVMDSYNLIVVTENCQVVV